MSAKEKLLKNIDVRETIDGTVFRVRISHKGQSYTATRDDLKEAIAWKDESKRRLKAGLPLEGDVPQGDMTLLGASGKFILSATDRSRSTISMYNFAQGQLLKYFGNHILLSEITPLRMHDYLNQRRSVDEVGASKLYQEMSFVRMVYQAAAGWGINIPSPEKDIPRPKRPQPSREDKLDRVIKAKEMTSFLTKAKGRPNKLYLFLMLLLYTGMRPSEAASLRWERMSKSEEKAMRAKKRHVGYVDLPRGGFSRVGTKTGTRFVPAHPVAIKIIEHLKKHRANNEETGEKDKFVFIPDEHLQRDRPYLFYRSSFETAREKAKIRLNIDFYSFRHTARSRMAVCGVQDSAAEEIVGHADKGKQMQAVYTHYEDIDLVREIIKLDYPWIKLELPKAPPASST